MSTEALTPTSYINHHLTFLTKPVGDKLWRCDYRHDGKRKTLADARQQRDEARRLLAQGIKPGEYRKLTRDMQPREADSFEAVACARSKPAAGSRRRTGRARDDYAAVDGLPGRAITGRRRGAAAAGHGQLA